MTSGPAEREPGASVLGENDPLSVVQDGPVRRITMTRAAKRNALSRGLVAGLSRAFADIQKGGETRVVVLAGDGPVFCAGADIGEFVEAAESGRAVADGEGIVDLLGAIAACPAPVVARIHGSAFGGAVGLVAACDLAIAAEGTRFSLSEARLGLVAAVIAPYVFAALGPREAKARILLASPFEAQEALRIGLIHRVVPADGLDTAIAETVAELQKGAPGALAAIKRLPGLLQSGDPAASRAATTRLLAERLASDEGREGLRAFLENAAGLGAAGRIVSPARLVGARVAIANRAEIAVRIAVTCRRLGAVPILLLGDPDMDGYAARQVGRVEPVGPAGSELEVERVVAAARRARADYLHPGYGFLSERAALADACAAAGVRFVGPSAETLRLCGDKLATRAAAERAGAPILPASPPLGDDPDEWIEAARRVGFPLLVKPTEAGGGRGLRHVGEERALVEAIAASRREAASSGAGAVVYLERELVEPCHVEVQVAGDGRRFLALGDRDCSLQRRHQKVIEEAPAPHVEALARVALHEHARRIAEAVGLRGIATCEFLLGGDGTLAFLEVNPRIQVEHPVTELVAGLDLVEWQLRIAAGEGLPLGEAPAPRGHAIEARLYAEDPAHAFFPAAGRLAVVAWPSGPDLRVDAGYAGGDSVPAAYDAMLAKIVVRGSDRAAALTALRAALGEAIVAGLPTNLPWLLALLDDAAVRAGRATTRTAGAVLAPPSARRPALLAAVAQTLDRAARAAADPWTAIGPFRLAGETSLTFHGDDWEERLVVRRAGAGWEIAAGDGWTSLRWWRDAAGVWTIVADERVWRLAVVEREDGLEIAGAGGRWLLRTGPRPTGVTARRDRAADGRVRAPMPAKVLALHAAPGDRVARGEPLVTLTAMKMELVCEAPIDGVVEMVGCAVDQLVEADQVLVTLRSDEPGVGASSE